MNKRPVICVTPVRNEAWFLDRFLRCAATWADHIVIADQQSDDGSLEIAGSHPKVTLVNNPSSTYDEASRQRLLLNVARSLGDHPIIVALDADEVLAANWSRSTEWDRFLNAPPGTVAWFRWANIRPDMQTFWAPPTNLPFGLVDDGSPHSGVTIHSPRIPFVPQSPSIVMQEIRVLHYQYVSWERMRSKQRWYQCWERTTFPTKRPAAIYRQYHHMDSISAGDIERIPSDWTEDYELAGINLSNITALPPYPWDHEVIAMLLRHGPRAFRKLDIWDVDWEAIASASELDRESGTFSDPRSRTDRLMLRWLRATQGSSHRTSVRMIQRAMRTFGW